MSPDDRNRFDDRGFADREYDDRDFDREFSDRNADRGLDRGMDRGIDRGFDDRNLSAADRTLEQQLAVSGHRARLTAGSATPSPIYAAELRERLVTKLETSRPPFFAFAFGRRIAHAIPVSVAALLLAVAFVGASQLNIGAPDPSESPVAATDEASPTLEPDHSFAPPPTDGAVFVPVATPTPAPATTPAPQLPTPPPPPPAPTPTPAPPGPAQMTLGLKSCDGGVLITWSKYKAGGFNHYTTLRNTVNTVPMAYPPQGGAVDFGGTYTTDVTALSAVDPSGAIGVTYYYRTMAFNAADGVVGATAVGSATALPMASLGTLTAAGDAGGTLFTWTPYAGHGACFTYYKLVASTTNPNPSYLNGDPYIWAGSAQADGSTVSPDLVSGQTYFLRIQVIRTSALGSFVAAQSGVTTYTVP
jgi:hypothetical protein